MLLSQWQNELQESILSGQNQLKCAVGLGHLSVELRLAVYQNAYILRLEEALRTNYPMMHQLLGDDEFSVLHKRYLLFQPPKHASIRWYGQSLPVFLQNTEPYNIVPVFAELAQFEWALRHTIDAATANRLLAHDLKLLSTEQWLTLKFCLHPSVTLLEFSWNTIAVWQALDKGTTPPTPELSHDYWVVWRGGAGMSEWVSVDQIMFQSLRLISHQKNFVQLCEVISQQVVVADEAHQVIAKILYECVEYKILCVSNE